MAVRFLALRACRPLFTPMKIPDIHFYYSQLIKAIVQLEGLGQLKNPLVSWGIEPAAYAVFPVTRSKCYY
jgi:hypothetical protein